MGKKSKLNVQHKLAQSSEPAAVESTAVEDLSSPIVEQVEEDSSTSAYLWLVVFSLLMFTFPFVTFYGVHDWLTESFSLTVFQVNCYSVLSAVLVVNAIICLYVFKAFSEDTGRSARKTK